MSTDMTAFLIEIPAELRARRITTYAQPDIFALQRNRDFPIRTTIHFVTDEIKKGAACACIHSIGCIPILAGNAVAQSKEVVIAYQDMAMPWRYTQDAPPPEQNTGYKAIFRKLASGTDVIRALASDSVQIGKTEDFQFHDLRHTWASWHRQAGTSCDELKDLGGSKSREMVDRYAKYSTDNLATAAARIERSQASNAPDSVTFLSRQK